MIVIKDLETQSLRKSQKDVVRDAIVAPQDHRGGKAQELLG